MAGSPLIVALAVVMLVYWFRYACTLALSARTEPACVAHVSAVNGLTFLTVRAQLRSGEARMGALDKSLDRDYRVLLYLLRHARGSSASIQQRLLLWDYLLMQMWYWCVRGISGAQARRALEERSRILGWLANEVAHTSPTDGSPTGHATMMKWHPKQHSSQQSTDSIKYETKSQKSLSARTMSSKAS
jgi:hypothetical protein